MDNPFDILFEPVQIGPVTAPNRFYQVPHCNGMGYRFPKGHAAMRGVKAEGGWGVVCTEEVEVHHTSDLGPYIEGRLWDERDVPPLELLVDAVHEHGALAGIELVYNDHAGNLYSRTPGVGVSSQGAEFDLPGQCRRMDKEDIRNVRRWHREAAIRAKNAGFDIVYCYAGHNITLAMHFLLKRYNDRSDEYGGSLKNRTRFLRELIEDTKDAVGDRCGVVVRFAVEEFMGDDGMQHDGEARDILAMLAELPDLWDLNVADWTNDSVTSRFAKEGFQEPFIQFARSVTTKPVVGVGRYTSPQSMVAAIKNGVMDMIGAARPSIADPFLPNKIKEGRIEDIRECIGCNICVTGDMLMTPIRCTQNPTMGEEYKRGWHPEIIKPRKDEQEVLVIGAGPAGLECARALGQRGYDVSLLEAQRELGGRVRLESALPGLSEWRRVMDWRLTQIDKLPNVSVYPENPMDVEAVLETGVQNVIVATGSHWRRDGLGRSVHHPVEGITLPHVFNPDDLMAGKLPSGKVVVFDDDHYYMGGVLAELLVGAGCEVALVTPFPLVSSWTQYSLEQDRIEQRLMELGVEMHTRYTLQAIQSGAAMFEHDLVERPLTLDCDAVVVVTNRISDDDLYLELEPALAEGKLSSLRVIGDAFAPNIIAQATFGGYLAAVEFGEEPVEGTPFKVEYPEI